MLFTLLLSTANIMLLRSVLRTVTYMDRHNRRKTSWAVARGTLGFTNKTDTDTVRPKKKRIPNNRRMVPALT